MDHPFNAEYVERLIEGQEEVERHFYSYFGPLLRTKIRRDPRTREMADDAAQETFLRVLRNLRRNPNLLEQPAKLGGYVLGVCNLVLMEFFRAENKYQGMPGGEDNRPDPRRDPAEEMTRIQEQRAVRVVLDGLSEKDRLLLSRIYLEERDKDDVCREFQIDRGYLRVLLHRAIGRCRTALLELDSGGAGPPQNFRGRQ